MTFKRVPMMAGLLALGMATACPETDPEPQLRELDAKLTASEISTNYSALSKGLAESVLFLNDSSTVIDALPQDDCITTPGGEYDCPPAEIGFDSQAQESADWLETHLFNETHVRADLSTPTALVFCLKTDDLCDNGPTLPGEPALDPDCVRTFTEVPACVRVTSVAEGSYDLAIVLGKQQEMNPLDVHLSAQRLAAEVKLGDAKNAFEAFAAASGETLGEEWPKQLTGEVGFEVVKSSEKSFTGKVAVRQAIALDLFDASDARRTEIRIGSAPELFKISVDALAKRLTASADVGSIDLKLAADMLFGSSDEVCSPSTNPGEPPICESVEKHYTGRFLAQLAGLSGALDLSVADAQNETLTIRDIGLGDQTSKIFFDKGTGSNEILAVDLNSALGRRVEMTLSKVGEKAQVKFSPGLTLRIAHDLQSLADQFNDITGWALKAVSEVELTGTDPALLIGAGTDGDSIKVVAGQLRLSASNMLDQSNVSITAGTNECVWAPTTDTTRSDDVHPFAQLVSGACQ